MSERTTPEQRHSFFEQHKAGKLYRQIADAAHVSLMCVRYWCRRLAHGQPATTTYVRRPRGLLQSFHPLVRYVLLRLRLEHPRWGPSRLRYHMGQRASLAAQRLPGCASIGHYLHRWPTFRRPVRTGVHPPPVNAPTQVHEVWQVDYKVAMPQPGGCPVNILDVRDPVGAAIIGSFSHPGGAVGQRPRYLTFPEIRADLRQCFVQWHTLPDRIQTDNEAVFIGKPKNDFPSPFVLWLKGLGIDHVSTRPRRPTDNAAVERQHRTINDYCIVGCHKNDGDLQVALARSQQELNQVLPSRAHGCHGQPPLCAHPELLQPRRPFDAAMELAQFDLRRVDAYLATLTWRRKVNRKGQVTLGGRQRRHLVGHGYAGQHVVARFDPCDRHIVFQNDNGDEVRRCLCRDLTIAALTGLDPWPDGPGIQQLPLPLDLSHR